MTSLLLDAPTNSAPNTLADPALPAAASKRAKEWRDETHVPDAQYNANVPVGDIEPDPNNRDKIDPAALSALAESIKSDGLLQPIVLRRLEDGRFRIIAGERRWRAHLELKRQTIAARIYGSETELDAARKKIAENHQREGLTPIEEAKRIRELSDLGMKQADIGKLLGKSQPVIANTLRILDLPPKVQDMVAAGELTAAHGVSLARFAKWPAACARMAEMARDHGYSSKHLNAAGLPFCGELVDHGLIEEIITKEYYPTGRCVYKLPRHFHSHRDFVVGERKTYYFVPADPKDNVWAPVKAEQDAERAKKQQAVTARESAQAAKNGGVSKEALERKKTIEKNKAQRAANVGSHKVAIDKLRKMPAPTALLVGILVERAIAGGFSAKRIKEAAIQVGVKLPPGVGSEGGGQGMRDLVAMAKMDVMALTRLAVAVILSKDLDDAAKNAWPLSRSIDMLETAKISVGVPKLGDQVAWNAGSAVGVKSGVVVARSEFGGKWDFKDCTPVRVTNGETPAGRVTVVSTGALYIVEPAPVAVEHAAATPRKKGGKK